MIRVPGVNYKRLIKAYLLILLIVISSIATANVINEQTSHQLASEVENEKIPKENYIYTNFGIVDQFTECLTLSLFIKSENENPVNRALLGTGIPGCEELQRTYENEQNYKIVQIPRYWHFGPSVIQILYLLTNYDLLKAAFFITKATLLLALLIMSYNRKQFAEVLTLNLVLIISTDLINPNLDLYASFQWIITLVSVLSVYCGKSNQLIYRTLICSWVAGYAYWFTDVLTLPILLSLVTYLRMKTEPLSSNRGLRMTIKVFVASFSAYFFSWFSKIALSVPFTKGAVWRDAKDAILERSGSETSWTTIKWWSGLFETAKQFILRGPETRLLLLLAAFILIYFAVNFKSAKTEIGLLAYLTLFASLYGVFAKQHLFIHAEIHSYRHASSWITVIFVIFVSHLLRNRDTFDNAAK